MHTTPLDARLARRRAKLFHGLAEPSRLKILYALADGPLNVSEVVERTGLTQPNASNHLACLLGCGLVGRSRKGRFSYYRHADEDVTTLLAVADRIVSDSASTILECPHCGGGV